ncbi:MAG: sulfur carrier protein ThiS [Verrucomicrobiaceae bacterium]|nr:sulfur carrier protein ThiS [Verrucomicrobiaceae bacterium]
MTITLNGKKQDTCATNISDLLKSIGLGDRPVVVEHNQRALLPREHAQTSLGEGDVVEVVQITAGG